MFVTVAGVDELLVEVVEICAPLLDLVEHLSGLDGQLLVLVSALLALPLQGHPFLGLLGKLGTQDFALLF